MRIMYKWAMLRSNEKTKYVSLSRSVSVRPEAVIDPVHKLKGSTIRGLSLIRRSPFYLSKGTDSAPIETNSRRRLSTNRDYVSCGLIYPEFHINRNRIISKIPETVDALSVEAAY